MSDCQYEYPATYSDPGYYCEDDADGAYCPRHDPEPADPEPASLYGHTNPGTTRLNAWAEKQELTR